jgi:hypothetical protein
MKAQLLFLSSTVLSLWVSRTPLKTEKKTEKSSMGCSSGERKAKKKKTRSEEKGLITESFNDTLGNRFYLLTVLSSAARLLLLLFCLAVVRCREKKRQ